MAQYTNPKKKKNNDIAPIRSDVGLFQRADNWNDVDNFWEGVGAFGETALASTADLGVNVVKGAGRLVEGVTDLFGHGIAGLADLLGFDEWSDEFRGYVNDSWVDNLASPADEFLDEYSIFGQTGDAIGEGIGQVASLIVTGGALGVAGLSTAGISAATTALMGASSMGSGMSEAYNAGANDKQAFFYGIMKGAIDAGSELIFGGLGKTVNALGISRGLSSLDDIVAKKLSSGISNQFFKNVVQWGVKSSAEGLEEVLAGIGTIAAKKLTYMSDEELGKLIKDENLFQQFIVGAVSAGVTQSGLIPGMKKGSLADTTKKGQDFVSGLTASEQKVADNLFEKAVKQKEADGKKLSGFEKNKIFDGIVEQMESGDIDVETIEDILKEDVYKDNKAKLDEEDALFKEYEELGKKKSSNISLAEETRYKELHEKTKELTFRKDLDSRMSEEVYNRVKDSRLASSYADAARRGDAFQADINEYDEAERATIQSAIDAGFLNNTNKTRRFVNWIAKIAAKTGIKVDFTTNEKLKQSGFAIDGKTINGYKTKDGIGINMQSKKVLETVVGHEITHVLEGTELYNEMQKILYDYADSKGELSTRRKAIENLYKGMKADIDSELTAELVGDYLFADQEFINRLANDNRNLFQKMWDEVKYMWSQAHPSSPEAQKLEKLKRAFEEAYKSVKDRTITENGIHYAIADSKDITPSKEQVDSNIQEVAAMDSVYTVDESKLSPIGKDLKEIYAEYFNEWGGNIHTDLFGDVAVRNSSIRSEIRHGSTAEKIASVEAIPSVLQNGKIVDWIEKEVGVYRIVVAAPIKIGDSPCIMGVMLQRDSQNQRLYLHDVVIEKEAIDSMQDDLVTTGSHKESDSLYTTMILQKVIDVKRNLKNSAKNDISIPDGAQLSLSSISNTFFNNEYMTVKEFENSDYKKTEGYKTYVDQCVNNMRQTRADFDEATARKDVEDSIDGIVRVALAAKKAGYDILDDSKKRNTKDSKNRLLFSSLEPNSDYFTSNDISTECDKRKNFAQIYDAIVAKEEALGVPENKRFFKNIDNYFYIHKVLADKGLTQPCRECYVESMRKNLAPMADAFLRLVRETNPNNTANNQLYDNKGKLKSNNAATREWVLDKLAEYGMTANDLTVETLSTEKGLAQLKIQAPMIYEAFNSFYGQSKPKMPKSATPFRFGELTALLTDNNGKINQNLVKKINSTGGFRLQSYSDFQIQNYTDVLQVIFEAGTLGLNGHAYTKVPAFLDATEGTNLKRNISIFMYKDGNDWKIDRNDSFPYTLEEIYDIVNADEAGNTSIIAVSQNNEMSAWIMANDMVGYGIPFHKSGLKMGTVRDTDVKTEDGRTVKGYAGTKDHTKQQTEVWAKTTADHKALTKVKKGIDIYSFWDFKNTEGLSKNELIQKNLENYIDRCEDAGYIPKFRDYVMNNGKVLEDVLRFSKEMGYVSQDATIDDISFEYKGYTIPYGYYKFLGDFGMFKPNGEASPQENLSLKNYDFDKAVEFFKDSETIHRNEILQQFANGEEREYYRNSDLDAGQLEDIVRNKRSEIADEIIAKEHGVQFSLTEDTTEATPRDVYFSRIDEVYDKLKGKAAGKSHSVDGYNFFLQKNDFDESAYISITTPEGEKLRHIVDGGNQWKNARLWREAAKMVSNHENPNVATATTQEEAGEYSEIEGKREETKKTFKEKVGDTKTLGRKAVGYLVDKYQPIENLALKTGNRELDAKANTMRTSERAAQHFIGNGADGVRAINDLRQEVEASGLENEFEEYMYDLLTTDRMSLEERAKPIIKKLGDKFKNMKLYQIKALAKREITQKTTETSAQYIRDAREYLRAISARNKPVRGDFYTADIARAHATELEQKYPQFKQWAEDVYANTNFMLNKLVADGELSQEAADRFRELYPHYVPIRRVNKEGNAIDVPLYSNRTGVDAPIKGATGGDGTIGYLFETLAMRAEQTFLAGAKNRFGIELKNTLKAKTTDADVDVEDIFEEVDTHEDRLKAGEDGQAPTFTVFENGKRVTFEIPEDIYDALKPTDEFWKQTFAVPNAITKFQRGVLTEYNPFFMVRNAVKDFQDVLINSQHAKETYKNFPEAMRQLYAYEHGGEDAQYAKEYFSNGAEDLTYFDGKEKLFDSKNTENPWAKEKNSEAKKIIGFIPSKISQASSFVERVPRLAEYIASRKAGASIDVAMLDAARVTTNFAAGGDVTKFANRNGATFLNASVQGAAQAVRNIREAKAQGLKGMLKLGAKVAIAGIPYLIVNALLWGDDDEYEELSDYIKENYYIVAKYGDGQFVRIPKGRMAAVIQSAFDQMSNLVTGDDEVDFERFGELLVENIAPNNPLENNILAPIMNVKENKTWYGDDLVPQRLQDLPAGEQSDETTDAISKWFGETINVSPYKLNYLLDQYSGVFGDMFLPAMTPQAEGGNSTILGGMIAPITDQFTTDSTMKNQNVSDFYDTLDDLTASAKSKHATDGDVLRYKYMNAVNSDISALYKQKREIQNSSLSNSVKYERVREIQRQIDELAKQALAAYNGISVRGNTATVGGYQFKKNKKGEWEKVKESSSSSNWSNDLFDWMSGFSNNFDIPDFNLD